MRIVFNTDQVSLHGGIEKVMAIKANYWASIPGYEVYIVTTEQSSNPPCYELDSRIKMIDLGVNYNRSISYFSGSNLKKSWLHFKRQKELFNQLRPDVIISPNFNFDHYWLPFIKKKSILIKERHGSRFYEEEQSQSFFNKIKTSLLDWVESKYNYIVVLNEDEKKYVRTSNAVTIPNPIEPQEYTAALENTKVIAAGRISPVKNFEHLIYAWSVVHKSFPNWTLDIYGENYLGTQEELEKLLKDLQLKSVVHFQGSIDDMPKKMSEYSIYAMTSHTECFPMVLLEALSVGLPVVSYDCPNGPRHIITKNQDGLLVENQNPNALANGLIELMENPEKRKGLGESAKINSQRFYTTMVMRKWQTLLTLSHV